MFSQLAFEKANEAGKSPTGTVGYLNNSAINLTTGSPVWVQFRQTTTEVLETIRFDYQFLSRGKGLLSVYVDDLMVFVAEEVDAGSAIRRTPLIPVGKLAPGSHTLALRLDPQTTDQSVVQVSNLQTGVAQLAQYQNQPPLAIVKAPSVARHGSTITLDGSVSSDPDNLPRPLGHSWKQEAGPPAMLNDWFVVSPTFVAAQPGQYAFTLTVTDGLAFVAASRITIAVPRLGDIDLDGDVDYLDLLRIVPALGKATSGPNDLRNINGDAKIDFQDLVALSKLCTRRLCAAK